MTGKIFRSIFAASLVTLVVSFLITVWASETQLNSTMRQQLVEEAAFAAEGMELSGEEFLKELDVSSRVTWIAADGTVIFDSVNPAETLPNHAEREEVAEALTGGSGMAVRKTGGALSAGTMYYALRLSDGTVLRVSSTQPSPLGMARIMLTPLIGLIALLLVFSAVYAVRMSRRIIRPINEINVEQPENTECYAELEPLIQRIRRQNSFIDRQNSEMRSRREEFMAITENMSEGFLLLDTRREIISYNSSARSILGIDRESGVVDNESALGQTVDAALLGSRAEREFSRGGADYRVIASPVMNGGEIGGAVAVILDITEKSRREAMRREFTSNVSHELKTPLTSINAAAEMLAGGMVRSEDVARFSRTIHNESSRLITLVNDIIRLSQMDENAIPDERVPVKLHELCRSVIDSLETPAAAKRVSFTLNGEAEVVGIPTILEEMVYNLCDNAVKYNKQGGSAEITLTDSPETVVFSIKDTGIGIPDEMLDRVFERFYRVDKSRSREIGGTGLGLSIVRHAANTHNADIGIKSRLGEGTEITVTFKK